jgi:riboflavin transporter
MKYTSLTTRSLTIIAMLGALSAVLMLFEVPLPFAPAYMRVDFADLPALFAGFFLGPVSGTLVIIIKLLIKLIIKGTETAFVGEFMNLMCSVAFLLPASLIYKYFHTKEGAILGLCTATAAASVFAVFGNLYIALPMYVSLYGISMDLILQMAAAVNPLVHDMTSFLLFCILPFNLLKYTLISAFTYLLYKRTDTALRRLLDTGKQIETIK